MIMVAVAGLSLVALLTAAAVAVPVLSRPTLPFGVRVPAGRVSDPAITAQRRRYTRAVLVLGALAALLFPSAAVLLGTPHVLQAGIVGLGAAHMTLFYTAHRGVSAAKRRGDWYAGTRQAAAADTTLRTDPVRLPWPLLIPAALLPLLTAAIGSWRFGALPATLPTLGGPGVDPVVRVDTTFATAFAPVFSQVALTLLTPLLAAALLRARPELDAARPAGSARRYRVYLRGLARLLPAGAACANLTLLLLALQLWEIVTPSAIVTVVTWLPLAAAAAAGLIFGVRVGEAGHRLPPGPGEEPHSGFEQRDDDRHWHLAGMVYANRADPAILVHQRAGGRWTLNLGNPVAWAILAGLAIVALLSLLGVVDLPANP
ncbi:DUF1648 domain-containing protein [Bailinhaonella thermotolerans]|uniref:DUF5808 domain-containing protein n=1 Tax=Bailinhaonella thermotolerans TaxID=1070861 RepID=A0A3A4B365_9ACTN|nr:hypothetical protein [Bailinhaonella thermotolerans]RJL35601.1 hypothetical protein D5H75_02085 [Bailinhaonella thermotolerans]